MRVVDLVVPLLSAALISIFVTTWSTFALNNLIEAFGYGDFWSLLHLINPLSWIGILAFGALFAILPATVLLGLAFLIARSWGSDYRIAGLIVGLAHACAGNTIKFAELFPYESGLEIWAVILSGFGLIELMRADLALLVIPASALGGWLGGAFFGRMVNPPRSARLIATGA
ncbi:MAG: hypothetical protein GW855_06620 [Erythrobacter sp.]|nr:hypothetical protein [Erythrobacter sp.]NCQ65170.1 hypothetical protein [Alphaproteobacteria bacterium]